MRTTLRVLRAGDRNRSTVAALRRNSHLSMQAADSPGQLLSPAPDASSTPRTSRHLDCARASVRDTL